MENGTYTPKHEVIDLGEICRKVSLSPDIICMNICVHNPCTCEVDFQCS